MTWFDTDVEDDGFGVSCKSIISSVIGKRIDDMMDVVLQADKDFLSKCVTFGLRKVTSFGLLPRMAEANLGKICFHCGTSEEDVGRKIMSCSRCKSIYYCSRQCQKDDWKRHKKECKDGFRIAWLLDCNLKLLWILLYFDGWLRCCFTNFLVNFSDPPVPSFFRDDLTSFSLMALVFPTTATDHSLV